MKPIVSESMVTTTTTNNSTVSSCQCGDFAVKFCQGCDLAYCDTCCIKRHRKGAFQRHTIVLVETKQDPLTSLSQEKNNSKYQKNVCEECIETNAVLWCQACELHFCIKCSKEVHKVGTMQSHVEDGQFQFLDQNKQTQCIVVGDDGTNGQKITDNTQTKEEIRDGETTEENPMKQEEQEQSLPSPSLSKKFSSDSTTNDSYNLWGGWNARTFADRSVSMDSSVPWTSLTGSISMDSKSSSVEDDLSLQSITKSLRSLSFAASGSDDAFQQETPDIFSRRSSSFSGTYTSSPLRRSWQQSHFDAPTSGTSIDDNEEEFSSIQTTETIEDSFRLTTTKPSVVELYQQLCSNFASRHVLIKSSSSRFDTVRVQQINDILNNFGAIAVKRDEFASEGLLFFTFFELKSAVSAVKLWHTTAGEEFVRDRINFCAPYEIPKEFNSATLLVLMTGAPIATNEMRQFCSRFGEVASVLQEDIHSSKYIVEYNDARDLSSAINELNGSFHAGGSINATRTHPPTLDMAKIQLFQDALENLSFVSPVLLSDTLSRKGRPKSLSSSGTSLMTTSPSSSSSSSMNASFFESGGSNSRASSPFSVGGAAYSSPLFSNLNASNSQEIWSSTGNSSSSGIATPSPPLTTAEGSYTGNSYSLIPSYQQQQQSYHGQGYHLQQSHSHVHTQGGGHLNPHLQQRGYLVQNKYVRSGSDPGFMRNNSSGGNGQNSFGRNDQGTGEFSLSIERVAASEDRRTTLMIRNIPNKYTQQMLLAEINQNHHGHYDFFYLPIDFKNKCNMGYAFINFMEPTDIVSFYQEFNDQKWTNFNSEKVCAISYARLQGKQAMIMRFQNSSLLEKHESYRPLVFVSNGPNRGQPETFPCPTQKIMGQPIKKNPLQLNNLHYVHAMNGGDEYYMGSPGRQMQIVGGHHGNFSLYQQQQHLHMNNMHFASSHSIPPPPSNDHHHFPHHTSSYSNGMM